MSTAKRILILTEVLIGFSFVSYFWVLGASLIWIFLPGIFLGDISAVLAVISVIFGGFGLYAIFKLTRKILWPDANTISPIFIKVSLFLGLLGLITSSHAIGGMESGAFFLNPFIFYPPFLVTLHLVYLGRVYLRHSS